MKKYNKPEIVALALESVDVIETSGAAVAAAAVEEKYGEAVAKVQVVEYQINAMSNKWSW